MGLFSRKPVFCAVCNKQISHKHKPKKDWGIKGFLCGDCHLDKMREFYEKKMKQSCLSCGVTKKISDLWEPRWQWDMDGLLCKECFDIKEEDFDKKKSFCSICGVKMGLIRFNPKGKWKIEGQLCRTCWDSNKEKYG